MERYVNRTRKILLDRRSLDDQARIQLFKAGDPELLHARDHFRLHDLNHAVHAGIADAPGDALYYPLCMGFVGVEASIALAEFAKNYANNVTGEELLNGYAKVRSKVKKLGQERWNICSEKLVEACSKLTELSPAQAKNVGDFMGDLPAELQVSLWSKLLKEGADRISFARSLHTQMPSVTKNMLQAFGVKQEDIAAAAATSKRKK